MSPSPLVDPFAEPYFADRLCAATTLGRAPATGQVAGVDVVQRIDSAHSVVYIGRRRDSGLVALKGFRPDAPVTAGWLATRNSETLWMIRCGHGGILPITEIHSLLPGGPIRYLGMPYCPGGSMRDRLAAGDLGVAELAYHGLAVVSGMRRLHRHGLIHGDVTPANVLFAYGADTLVGDVEAKWRTVLSDLETTAEIGGPTSWRMTLRYAAPEQTASAAAAPAMDVWAWGKTMREGLDLVAQVPNEWSWLVQMVDRAISNDAADRPTSAEIIDSYGQHIGFGDHDRQHVGAAAGARYPTALMPQIEPPASWQTAEGVHIVTATLGWAALLPDCQRLYDLHTVAALLRIEELCHQVLGEPDDPDSVWHALGNKSVTALPVSAEAAVSFGVPATNISSTVRVIPRAVARQFVTYLAMALVELVEMTGEPADLDRLRVLARAWESIDEFESEVATALLAQAWLSLDDPQRALPYVRRSYAADPRNPSALAAMRLYYIVTGDRRTAAAVALQPKQPHSDDAALRWVLMAIVDLLEAQAYDELDEILDGFSPSIVDTVELVRAVAAGRRGPVQPDPRWLALQAHCASQSDLSIEKVRYLVEAAFQRGERDFAVSRAEAARAQPALRMPIHHQPRATIEAVALGRDPADRGLTARLNNRAELWARDGRLDDPLVGLDLAAAQWWATGPDRARLSTETLDLVSRSAQLVGEQHATLLQSRHHCVRCRVARHVHDQSVCGNCHRLYCTACSGTPSLHRRCVCGGDLARPPEMQDGTQEPLAH